jgi:hypothetical protein
MSAAAGHAPNQVATWEQIALVDLLDRILTNGVVVSGEVTLSIADVDLVYVSLRALVSSVRRGEPGPVSGGSDDDDTPA